jgi:ribosome-associated heat shock protein Hsp15
MALRDQRLDRWLWFARIAKSRSLAGRLIGAGKVRVNRVRITKPGRSVRIGDVITATIHGRVRVLRIEAGGSRRGPAEEARTLYTDLTPPAPPAKIPVLDRQSGKRLAGSGRPTKRERRQIEKLMRRR